LECTKENLEANVYSSPDFDGFKKPLLEQNQVKDKVIKNKIRLEFYIDKNGLI
jgi:hypothetical protein